MVIIVFGVIIVHTLAIATHAVGYMVAGLIAVTGDFVGLHGSLISATTLSMIPRNVLGDIYPIGHLRMMAIFEVLSGLILIG
jgi:hypothetical protein